MTSRIDAVAVHLDEMTTIHTREDVDLILRSPDRLVVVTLQNLDDCRITIVTTRYYVSSTHIPIYNRSVLSLSNLGILGIKHNVFEGNLGHRMKMNRNVCEERGEKTQRRKF